MAGHPSIWRTEPEGVLAAEIDGLRLVVQAPEKVGGLVRFLVLRRDAGGDTIIGSGTEGDVRAAMQAAIQMAERILERQLKRPSRID